MPNKSFLASVLLVMAAAIVLLLSGGCGGAGRPRASGSLQMTVRWPSTRDIPPATRSLKVTAKTLKKDEAGVTTEDKLAGEKVVVRPEGQASSTISLDDLPSVDVRVKVLAFASTDASGDPIALGTKDVTIASGQTSTIAITLHGDIASIEATPTSLTLDAGETKTITMSAQQLDGSPALIDESRWQYTSQNTGIATVSPDDSPERHIADVHGIAAGATNLVIRDSLTGVSTTVPITVSSNATVQITPEHAAVAPGGTTQFSASVLQTSDQRVTWSAAPGSISAAGVYTAAAEQNLVMITATSVADPSKSGTAWISVWDSTDLSVPPALKGFQFVGTMTDSWRGDYPDTIISFVPGYMVLKPGGDINNGGGYATIQSYPTALSFYAADSPSAPNHFSGSAEILGVTAGGLRRVRLTVDGQYLIPNSSTDYAVVHFEDIGEF